MPNQIDLIEQSNVKLGDCAWLYGAAGIILLIVVMVI